MSRSMSTASGGITMGCEAGADDADGAVWRVREVDVLKNVVLREEYIRRLEGKREAAAAAGRWRGRQ